MSQEINFIGLKLYNKDMDGDSDIKRYLLIGSSVLEHSPVVHCLRCCHDRFSVVGQGSMISSRLCDRTNAGCASTQGANLHYDVERPNALI